MPRSWGIGRHTFSHGREEDPDPEGCVGGGLALAGDAVVVVVEALVVVVDVGVHCAAAHLPPTGWCGHAGAGASHAW